MKPDVLSGQLNANTVPNFTSPRVPGGKGSGRAQRAGEARGAGLASPYGSQLPRNKEKIKM